MVPQFSTGKLRQAVLTHQSIPGKVVDGTQLRSLSLNNSCPLLACVDLGGHEEPSIGFWERGGQCSGRRIFSTCSVRKVTRS